MFAVFAPAPPHDAHSSTPGGPGIDRQVPLRQQVRALVRGRDPEALVAIPQSVQIIPGDIGDYKSCHDAMQGVDKVRAPPPSFLSWHCIYRHSPSSSRRWPRGGRR